MRADFFSDKNILFKNVKAEILRNFIFLIRIYFLRMSRLKFREILSPNI